MLTHTLKRKKHTHKFSLFISLLMANSLSSCTHTKQILGGNDRNIEMQVYQNKQERLPDTKYPQKLENFKDQIRFLEENGTIPKTSSNIWNQLKSPHGVLIIGGTMIMLVYGMWHIYTTYFTPTDPFSNLSTSSDHMKYIEHLRFQENAEEKIKEYFASINNADEQVRSNETIKFITDHCPLKAIRRDEIEAHIGGSMLKILDNGQYIMTRSPKEKDNLTELKYLYHPSKLATILTHLDPYGKYFGNRPSALDYISSCINKYLPRS